MQEVKTTPQTPAALTDIGLIDPKEIAFSRTQGGFIACRIGWQDYPRDTLSRALPFSQPERYLSVFDAENKELGILKDLNELAPEQAQIAREELRRRYFNPVILEIRSIKEKMGYLYMDVRLSGGDRVFAIKDYARSIRAIDSHRLVITDSDGNRYTIEDIETLETRSRHRLEPYLL